MKEKVVKQSKERDTEKERKGAAFRNDLVHKKQKEETTMNRDIELSDEFREVIERRYAFAIHFTRACRERKIGLPADFLKLQFKDLITPSGILITTLEGRTDAVECLTVVGNKLYSGSYDTTIGVWDTDTHQHIATLEGHTDGVCCLTVVGNKLYSASYDKTIRVWTLF